MVLHCMRLRLVAHVGSTLTRAGPGRCRYYSRAPQLLKTWADKVSSIGRLSVSLSCNVNVVGTGSRLGLGANAVNVSLAGGDERAELPRVSSLITCDRADDEDGTSILISDSVGGCSHAASDLTLTVELPSQYDLSLDVRNGTVNIAGIESSSVSIMLTEGTCNCMSLKAGNISVIVNAGDIILRKATIGNMDLKVKDGSVSADRLQGQHVAIAVSGRGGIAAKSLYAVTASVTTDEGHVSMGSCHGSISAKAGCGNVKLKSVKGSLAACTEHGNVDVYLVQHDEASLKCTTGDITVRLPESGSTRFSLRANQISIDDNLLAVETDNQSDGRHRAVQGYVGPETTGKQLSAVTGSGTIAILASNWFAAQTNS